MFLVSEAGCVGGVYLSSGLLEIGDGTALAQTIREGIASSARDLPQPKSLLTGLTE